MPMEMKLPRVLTIDEMEREADAALQAFVKDRMTEGTAPYLSAFKEARQLVSKLFAVTGNLMRLESKTICDSPDLIQAVRFLGGPPLSQDDLDTLSGGQVCARKSVDEELAARAIEVVRTFLDTCRYPWIDSTRNPSKAAIRNAVDWTSSLWAVEKCKTLRRIESSAVQERRVADMLQEAGLQEELAIRTIRALDDLPRGRFTREIVLGNPKADLAVRLLDGRLLAIECKVSNSAVNSVKRLNRETGGKADKWRNLYGRQVVTAAVLSGVFKVGNLIDAQSAGVYIFWDHGLASLQDYVRQACFS